MILFVEKPMESIKKYNPTRTTGQISKGARYKVNISKPIVHPHASNKQSKSKENIFI